MKCLIVRLFCSWHLISFNVDKCVLHEPESWDTSYFGPIGGARIWENIRKWSKYEGERLCYRKSLWWAQRLLRIVMNSSFCIQILSPEADGLAQYLALVWSTYCGVQYQFFTRPLETQLQLCPRPLQNGQLAQNISAPAWPLFVEIYFKMV